MSFTSSDNSLVRSTPRFDRAAERWKQCEEWYGSFADRFLLDMRFRHGDAHNGWQWDETTRRRRQLRGKPCLTMNMIQVHNRLITNAARQNKIGMNVVPVGNGATLAAAQMFKQLMEQIEHQSSAQDVYAQARGFQVDGGLGYFRLVTRWAKWDGFEQEIYLEGCDDPMRVWLDPDAKLPHGGDANYGFEWDLVHRDLLEQRYPRFKGEFPQGGGFGFSGGGYIRPEHVVVCEFLERRITETELLSFIDPGSGDRKTIRGKLLPPEVRKEVKAQKTTRSRSVEDFTVESTTYIGDEEVETTTWAGSYIPIIRVEGEKVVLDGQLDYKGHTRAMIDAQRMYNYNSSGQVEFVALQGKSPYVAAAEAVEDYAKYWETANTEDHAFLPYKPFSESGEALPPPQRQQGPQFSQGLESGMQTALMQMQLTSGQHENQMGMQGNERTGEAIQSRQAQSDLATSHFDANFESAVLWAGTQVLELIPLVYDTKRLVNMQGDKGEDMLLQIDPSARQAYQEKLGAEGMVAQRILNPQVGRYEVRSRPGPDAGTRREQTRQALMLILTQAPALVGVVGDLVMKCLDFEEAEEAAQRLRRMVPPQAMGQGPSQAEQALQQQVASLKEALAKALEGHGKATLKLAGREQARDVDVYKALTERLKVIGDLAAGGVPGAGEDFAQTQAEAQEADPLGAVVRANAGELADDTETPDGGGEVPPHPDAQKAPDGQWYLKDPTRQRGYLKLAPPWPNSAPRPRRPRNERPRG